MSFGKVIMTQSLIIMLVSAAAYLFLHGIDSYPALYVRAERFAEKFRKRHGGELTIFGIIAWFPRPRKLPVVAELEHWCSWSITFSTAAFVCLAFGAHI